MAKNRTIPIDFWTWEAVIDCKPMTRLLFLGLWTFADDGGVQPLRPRTIRMQVFPGDDLDSEQVRAMIDELAARKLVRIFSVDGQEYLSIVDWEQIQTVSARAKRRYPRDPAKPLPVERPAPTASGTTVDPRLQARWRKVIGKKLRKSWPGGPPEDTESWIARWMAEGYDLEREIVPAITDVCRPAADRDLPTGLHEVATAIAAIRARRTSGAAIAAPSRTVHAAA